MADTPLVSVLMPVYNAEQYLKAAIESILNQTFKDFELIIINDGSKDKSLDIIKGFKDPRIIIVDQENQGVTATLNKGLELAKGTYIARQDADDLSLPTRFEHEVSALQADSELGLIGSNYTIIDEQDNPLTTTKVFCHPDDVKLAEAMSNQFGHGSIMLRRSVLAKVGNYQGLPGYAKSYVEDADLWMRISHVAKIGNLKESLYLWRRNPVGVSLSNMDEQIEQAFKLRDREFARLLANRRDYRIFSSFHPFNFSPDLISYIDKKSIVFRDLAYLYRTSGNRGTALGMQLIACMLAPWRKRNWRCLKWLLTLKDITSVWEYEFV